MMDLTIIVHMQLAYINIQLVVDLTTINYFQSRQHESFEVEIKMGLVVELIFKHFINQIK